MRSVQTKYFFKRNIYIIMIESIIAFFSMFLIFGLVFSLLAMYIYIVYSILIFLKPKT